MRKRIRTYSTGMLTLIIFFVIMLCYALAMNIPSTPLFVTQIQSPNVMIALDTSPTMLNTAWHGDYNPTPSVAFNEFDPNFDWNVLIKKGGSVYLIYHDKNGKVVTNKEKAVGAPDTTVTFDINDSLGVQHSVTFPIPPAGPISATDSNYKQRVKFSGTLGTVIANGDVYPCYAYNGKYLNWAFQNNKNISGLTETRLGSLISSTSPNSINNFVKSNTNFSFGLMRGRVANTDGGRIMKACGEINTSNVDSVLESEKNWSYQNIPLTFSLVASSSPNVADSSNDAPLGEMLAECWRYFRGEASVTSDLPGVYGSSYPTIFNNATQKYVSPITATCQTSFIVLFSSGRPHMDENYPTGNFDSSPTGMTTSDEFTSGAVFQSSYPVTPSSGTGGVTYYSSASSPTNRFMTRAHNVAAYIKNHDASAGQSGTQTVYTLAVGVGYSQPTDDNAILQQIGASGGAGYESANNLTDLGTALSNISNKVVATISSASSVAVNTAFLTTNTQLFTAQFYPNLWTGDVMAFTINVGNGDIEGYPNSPAWSAASQLANKPAADRKLFSCYSTSSSRFTHIDFTDITDSNTATLQSLLGTDDATYTSDTARVINTIRGVNTGVAGYRIFPVDGSGNVKKLGDVVSSSPVFAGPPPFNYSDLGYGRFQRDNEARKGMVYIGGNDGMLHAFHAGTVSDATLGAPGNEVWGYIPNHLMKGARYAVTGDTGGRLRDLARPNPKPAASETYGSAAFPHRFMVNGTATAGDAVVGFQNYSTPKWGSVLVGTEKEGGKGVFALDVTDPRPPNSSANALGQTGVKQLWEFSDWDDTAMGYSFSTVAIAKIRYSAPQSSGFVPHETWAAIFGNGYNSSEGKAYLMVVDIKTGKLIRKIRALPSTHGEYDTEANNGLSSPAVITDSSNYVSYVYAGDLRGHVYKFDFKSGTSPSGGTAAQKWQNYVDSWDTRVIFNAKDASNNSQPITSAPDIVKATIGVSVKTVILFGTGKYLENSDITSTAAQTFYGVFEPASGTLARSDLTPQTLVETTLDGHAIRYVSTNSAVTNGWYVDLPSSGERVVTDPVAYSGNVIFSSFIPTSSICDYGGYSWLNVLNFKTGSQPARTDLDIGGDGAVSGSDTITVGGTTYNPSSLKYTNVGMASTPTILTAGGGIAYKYTTLSSGKVEKTTETGSAAPGYSFIRAWREKIPYTGI